MNTRTLKLAGLALAISSFSFGVGFAGGTHFYDLPDGAFYTDAVIRMERWGLIQGYPDQTFRGEKPLTRGEATMIFDRLMEKIIMPIAKGETCDSTQFDSYNGDIYFPGEVYGPTGVEYRCEGGAWIETGEGQ